jgi:hypothetical protein
VVFTESLVDGAACVAPQFQRDLLILRFDSHHIPVAVPWFIDTIPQIRHFQLVAVGEAQFPVRAFVELEGPVWF